MRCVFTDGVLDAFMDNNIEISDVYGISAGSKAMQYYPSHQRGNAFKCDIESSKDPNTFNMANLLIGKPVIDSDYYINEIRDKRYPLDMKLVLNSPIELHVGCTNVETCEEEYFLKSDPDFTKSMVASCSLPVLCPIVDIRGKKYMDGGIAETIPFRTAIKDGFKKIIIVETRGYGYRESESQSSPYEMFYKMRYQNYPKFIKKLEGIHTLLNSYYDEADELEKSGKAIIIRPSYEPDVSQLETDQNKLIRLYQDGYNEGLKAIYKFMDYFKD